MLGVDDIDDVALGLGEYLDEETSEEPHALPQAAPRGPLVDTVTRGPEAPGAPGAARPYAPPGTRVSAASAPMSPTAPLGAGPLAPAPAARPIGQVIPESWRTATGIVVVAAGAGIGYALGKWWGLGAGALLAGGARNAVRAGLNWGGPHDVHAEAQKSAAVAVFGLGGGAVMAYKAVKSR